MGIINATPDSFSGDGVLCTQAVERARQMIAAGADILDIGGESTRPGAAVVGLEEELQRVIPIVETLARDTNIAISVDTTKAEVARRALDAGASIINDISSATFDAAMTGVLRDSDCGIVWMHLRGTPQTMGWSTPVQQSDEEKPSDLIKEIAEFWKSRIRFARESGIDEKRLCLDAGFGFGKSMEENLEILRRGRELLGFDISRNWPILSGTSRKSTIGKVLGGRAESERIWGTSATVAIAIQNGADIIRVHDVEEMVQVARMTDAVVKCKGQQEFGREN